MAVLKVLTIIFAALLSVALVRRVLARSEAVKVRANKAPAPRRAVRLRQDPRTGIYYPEK